MISGSLLIFHDDGFILLFKFFYFSSQITGILFYLQCIKVKPLAGRVIIFICFNNGNVGVVREVMALVRSSATCSVASALVFNDCTHTSTFSLSSAAIFFER